MVTKIHTCIGLSQNLKNVRFCIFTIFLALFVKIKREKIKKITNISQNQCGLFLTTLKSVFTFTKIIAKAISLNFNCWSFISILNFRFFFDIFVNFIILRHYIMYIEQHSYTVPTFNRETARKKFEKCT